MNAKICSNCRETYDASLSRCPKCGFSVESSNSGGFNIRNPFLELESSNSTNSSPAINSSVTNNQAISNSNVSVNSAPNNMFNLNNGVTPVPTNNTPSMPVQNTNEQQTINPTTAVQSSNEQPISNQSVTATQVSNKPKSKAFEPYVDNKKYEVNGIDFNSFFDNKPTDEKKESTVVEQTTTPVVEESKPVVTSDNNQTVTQDNSNQELNVFNNYNPSMDFERNRLAVLREEENKKAQQEEENKIKKEKSKDKIIGFYKYDFFFMSFITMAILVLSCLTDFSMVILVHGAIDIILMVIGYNLAFDRSIKAGYVGLLVSVLLIANIIYGDYINVIVGALILAHSVLYLLDFKKKKV